MRWRAIVATPGNRPFDHLAQALAAELGDAPGTADLLASFEEPGVALELLTEWRGGSEHALVIVDQFEELFTQNPDEVQRILASGAERARDAASQTMADVRSRFKSLDRRLARLEKYVTSSRYQLDREFDRLKDR